MSFSGLFIRGVFGPIRLLIVLSLLCTPALTKAETALAVLTGDYLGQMPPGRDPVLFAPGFISNALYTRDAAITPDGAEFLYSIFAGGMAHIMSTRLENGRWSEPREVFTSDMYQECEPALTPDGGKLLFLCNGDPAKKTAQTGWRLQNIWIAEREGNGWGEPVCLAAPVNDSTSNNFYPSLTRSGTLYFTRQAEDRSTAIYRSEFEDGAYREPQRLGEGVNSTAHQFNACIAPDESYLVFCSRGRDDNIGRIDYYVSFRNPDGIFGEANNLGAAVNSEDNAVGAPSITPDGRYFFFASSMSELAPEIDAGGLSYDRLLRTHHSPQNGSSNIYWVDTSCIRMLATAEGREQLALEAAAAAEAGKQPGRNNPERSVSATQVSIPELPILTGDYFGQVLPGDEPELFAPGIISTGMCTRDFAMTPGGDEIYFTVHAPNHSYSTILQTRRVDGKWSRPEVAPFAADPVYTYIEPFISPDGRRFYYISTQPDPLNPDLEPNPDIWVMDRDGDRWSAPRRMESPVNSPEPEFFPSLTTTGTIYFSRADAQTGIHDIYRSRLNGGVYQEPEKLGPEVNAGRSQFNAFISPDESYLIVCSIGIEETFGSVDYYVSFRDEQDRWSGPFNLGDKVNTPGGMEFSPYVSPSGEYFFFMSSRMKAVNEKSVVGLSVAQLLADHNRSQNGNPDIYWMKADFIEALKPR